MSDINLNVGTEGSSLDRSNITVGDISTSKEKRIVIHFQKRLQEVEAEVKRIREFLAGSSMGEPGLTSRVNEVIHKIKLIEKDLEMLDIIDRRLDEHSSLLGDLADMLENYKPMLEEMRAVYRTKTPIPVYVFYGVLVALVASVAVVYLLLWMAR